MDQRFGSMLAVASVLALACATDVRAQDDEQLGGGTCDSTTGCLTTALTGLVSGFAGQAGGQLWGWMLGGGQSAGTSGIADALANIASTLATIETDLGKIEGTLQKLQCGFDVNFVTQYAGPIQSYYQTYANWLTDMCNPDAMGNCQKTGTTLPAVSDVSEWANCATGFATGGQFCQDDKILTLLDDINNAAKATAGAGGSIADCIKTQAGPPATGSLDDRPYYNDNVVPITDWYLGINTQAMIVLTEAYHFRAWIDADHPTAEDTDQIYTNVCTLLGGPPRDGCIEPITLYNNDFLVFAKRQLQAGGAPYSTDNFLMVNGTDQLVVRSIETYDEAAGANCPDPNTDLCGPTVGAHGFTMKSVAVGPYGYGTGSGKGTWTPASWNLFNDLLDRGYNASAVTGITAGDFLCTMSFYGGDEENCIQPTAKDDPRTNGGAGLQNINEKGIYFPETLFYDSVYGTFQCFVDGNLANGTIRADQPICTKGRINTIMPGKSLPINSTDPDLKTCQKALDLTSLDDVWAVRQLPGLLHLEKAFENFYEALLCQTTPGGRGAWVTEPWFRLPSANAPKSYQWPALDWTQLTCSDGASAGAARNPAGVPTMCGEDFDAWFSAQVPPGPTTTTAIADTTISRGAPNANDGAGARLDVRGRQALIAFDAEQIQAFLEAGPLASAQLVLTSADRSVSGGRIDLVALPLLAGFVEGNGDAAEGDRGTGTGATWSCAEDADIGDQLENCLEAWPNRIIGRWRSAPRVSVPDGHDGLVGFDVTEHVADGISAWMIHRERGGGSFAFHSGEGAELLADDSLAPTLFLHRADEGEEVAQAQ